MKTASIDWLSSITIASPASTPASWAPGLDTRELGEPGLDTRDLASPADTRSSSPHLRQ